MVLYLAVVLTKMSALLHLSSLLNCINCLFVKIGFSYVPSLYLYSGSLQLHAVSRYLCSVKVITSLHLLDYKLHLFTTRKPLFEVTLTNFVQESVIPMNSVNLQCVLFRKQFR